MMERKDSHAVGEDHDRGKCVIDVGDSDHSGAHMPQRVRRMTWKLRRASKIRDTVNKDAYEPKVISLGPVHFSVRFRSTKEQYLNDLVMRTESDPKNYINCVLQMIGEKEVDKAADFYIYDGEEQDQLGDRQNLAALLVVDSCFIIELFLKVYDSLTGDVWGDIFLQSPLSSDDGQDISSSLTEITHYSMTGNAWGDIFHQSPLSSYDEQDISSSLTEITHDMLLLENQIPFSFLKAIFDAVVPDRRRYNSFESLVIKYFRTFINIDSSRVQKYLKTHDDIQHLLHLFHACVVLSGEHHSKTITSRITSSLSTRWSWLWRPKKYRFDSEILRGKRRNVFPSGEPQLINSATELKRLGITSSLSRRWPWLWPTKEYRFDSEILRGKLRNVFGWGEPQLINSATELKRLGIQIRRFRGEFHTTAVQNFLNVKFKNGVLEIAPFHGPTYRVLQNLMAFEELHHQSASNVTTYGYFLRGLLKSKEDVSLLMNSEILLDWKENEEDIVKKMQKLCEGIRIRKMDDSNWVWGLMCKIQEYCDDAPEGTFQYYTKRCVVNPWEKLATDYFDSPWKGLGTVGAICVVLLTILQTIVTVMQFVKKWN